MRKFCKTIQLIILAAVITTLAGCSKFPNKAVTTGKQLVITMTVRGRINPLDELDPSVRRHYFVAIDVDNNSDIGPWAAAYPPYGGNGWVTSSDAENSRGLTSYIQYDAANPDGYIYGVLPGSYFLNTSAPQPVIRSEILDNGATIRFVVDFSQIATSSISADQISQININLITTNILAVGGQFVEGRQWDGLGPSGQDYVTIDASKDRVYRDDDYDSNSVPDADLDIVSWTVEVQTVSSGS